MPDTGAPTLEQRVTNLEHVALVVAAVVPGTTMAPQTRRGRVALRLFRWIYR